MGEMGAPMKHKMHICLAIFGVVCLFGSLAAAQSDSLADYARATRKEKKTTAKQYDNDNLPKSDKLSIVGNAEAPKADADTAKPNDEDADEFARTAPGFQGMHVVENSGHSVQSDQPRVLVDLLRKVLAN